MGDYEQDSDWELSEEDFSDELEDEFSQDDLANISQGKNANVRNWLWQKYFENVIRLVLHTVRNLDKCQQL